MSQSQITKGRATEDAAVEDEEELGRWLRECDHQGVLPAAEAAMDMAYARGYKRGLEEGRADHEDALRTLVMKGMELKFGQLDDEIFERIGDADRQALEQWIADLITASTLEEALGA